MLQELNPILDEIGTLLTADGTLAGYDIYFAETPTQPTKSSYPWVDILALDSVFGFDITNSSTIKTQIVLRVYSKATDVTTSSLLASQAELNAIRDWVVETIVDNSHSPSVSYIWWKLLRASRVYLEKSSKDASVCDIETEIQYMRRP